MSAVITKAVAEIQPGADDASSDSGTFEVILSAPTLDRDGDTLNPDEWKQPLPDHITFDVDHGMSVATTVGSGTPRIEDDGTLRVSGTYSSIPRAQEVRTLVNERHIRTTSVAFMTTKTSKSAKPQRELLNGAFVAVPSNREAVVLSSKSFRKERKTVTHKSIVGSVEALQDRVNDALEDAYGDGYGFWGWLRGVIPEGDGGTVVFQSSRLSDGYDSATYQQTYTDDGAVVTLTGTASEVDIHEIVVPDADADRETVSTLSLGEKKDVTSTADTATALEAERSTADDERDLLAIRAHGIALRARAVL